MTSARCSILSSARQRQPRASESPTLLILLPTPTRMSNKDDKRIRVAIVGAGSSGMSAAHSLALSPDKYDVTLFERSPHCGGMATSTEIDPSHGASYINDGVQGEPVMDCAELAPLMADRAAIHTGLALQAQAQCSTTLSRSLRSWALARQWSACRFHSAKTRTSSGPMSSRHLYSIDSRMTSSDSAKCSTSSRPLNPSSPSSRFRRCCHSSDSRMTLGRLSSSL